MATQTRTSRQAAGSKAAATRKNNAARQSAGRTKSSARTTRREATTTARAARGTARQAGRTAGRRADAVQSRLESFARQAERALVLIPVGAALESRDAIIETVRIYTDGRRARRELNRFERRGEAAVRRNRRNIERQTNKAVEQVRDLF